MTRIVRARLFRDYTTF